MVDVARETCPEAMVIQADIEARADLEKIRDQGPFDYIILSDTLAFLDDIEMGLSHVRQLCGPSTRVIMSRYNQLWEPALKLGEFIGLKQSMKFDLNWISRDDVRSFCALSGLDLLTSESHQIIPFRLMGWGI